MELGGNVYEIIIINNNMENDKTMYDVNSDIVTSIITKEHWNTIRWINNYESRIVESVANMCSDLYIFILEVQLW